MCIRDRGKIYTYVGEVKPLKKVYMGNLINGLQQEGKWIEYLYTGQKLWEENYKNGEVDGLSTNWYKNGQKESERTFKDGTRNGLWTDWNENGQKEKEINYKDGKQDGLWTEWYENGQKKYVMIYKDGEKISGNRWNEDGSVEE